MLSVWKLSVFSLILKKYQYLIIYHSTVGAARKVNLVIIPSDVKDKKWDFISGLLKAVGTGLKVQICLEKWKPASCFVLK